MLPLLLIIIIWRPCSKQYEQRHHKNCRVFFFGASDPAWLGGRNRPTATAAKCPFSKTYRHNSYLWLVLDAWFTLGKGFNFLFVVQLRFAFGNCTVCVNMSKGFFIWAGGHFDYWFTVGVLKVKLTLENMKCTRVCWSNVRGSKMACK